MHIVKDTKRLNLSSIKNLSSKFGHLKIETPK